MTSTFPASPGQHRLWLAGRLLPGSTAYNVPVLVGLGATDHGRATAALTALVERHEALRTALEVDGAGEPVQVVHDRVPVEVEFVDARDHAGAPAERFERCARELAAVPIPVERAPLWRARLVRVAGDEHWLVLVVHHVVCDATSAQIIADELVRLCQDDGPPLPDLALQYADWAVWQREQVLTPARVRRQLDFWRAQLDGAPAVHALVTDHPRTAVPTDAGGDVGFAVAAGLADRVDGLARRLRATPFHVHLAAWVALLARLGGRPDVVLGVPVTGRHDAPVESLVGMFVNTVPLRVRIAGDPRFAELVRQVAGTAAGALDHADVPLQRIVEELVPRRDPTVAPLYQIGFNHLPRTPVGPAWGTARDELTLVVSGEEGRLEYRRDLFTPDTAAAVVRRYQRVLAAAVDRPETALSRLPLLGPAERALVLDRWSGATEPSPAPGPTVVEQVLAQAAATPDAAALTGPDGPLSYGELAGRVRRLAARLRAAGVGPDRVVAVLLPRSPELVVALLAVLAAGGAYLPVDPRLPAERVGFLLADSGATAVVAAGAGAPHPVVLDVADDPDGAPLDRVIARATHPAYVIYTSGSAGRPKGVLVEHRSLANYVSWFVDRHRIGPADRVLASTPPSFDAFVIELFPVLVAGGTLVVAPETAGFDPDALLGLAAEHEVTVLATVPAVLRLLVDSPALARCGALRQVVSGGEQLPGGLARDLTARLPVALHNLYGPTETTVDVAAHTATPADGPGPVPIGRPVAGARLHVLDAGGEPVPVGVPGHLHVGGVPVARGYLGRPGLTADRFVPDPFGPPGGRLYRTGDLVRWDGAGVLHFLGRLDDQVKLRGHRVEPGEVAAALRALPGVRDAAAVVREDRAGDPRLVGYVVADGAPDPAELRAALHRVLPGHLVPAAVVVLPRLPLTGHGKLDAAALPAPEPGTRGVVAPAGPAEELVAAVWAEVLGVPRVGADDDFFDLGGHSLHAARIAVRLSDAIGAAVPIALLFSHPTLGDLAAVVVDLLAEEIDRLTDDEAARQLARPGDAP